MRCKAPCGYLFAGPNAQDAQWSSGVHEQRKLVRTVWLAHRVDTEGATNMYKSPTTVSDSSTKSKNPPMLTLTHRRNFM
jgi:hypothetical protein